MNCRLKILSRVVTILVIYLGIGCKKYEEGPVVSLRLKTSRLVGTWSVTEHHINGTPLASQNIIENTYQFKKNSDYFVSEVLVGNWDWLYRKNGVKISSVDGNTAYLIIEKLTKEELWYTTVIDGSEHRLKLDRQ